MTVDIFVQWIYTQKLMSIGAYACPHFQISRIKAAILGDRFQSPDFTKAVRYELISVLVESPLGASGEAAIYAFENLPAEDLLLNLLVDAAASHRKLYEDREELETWRSAFRRHSFFYSCKELTTRCVLVTT